MTTSPIAEREPETTGLDGDWRQPFTSSLEFGRFSGALPNYIGDSTDYRGGAVSGGSERTAQTRVVGRAVRFHKRAQLHQDRTIPPNTGSRYVYVVPVCTRYPRCPPTTRYVGP